MGNCRNIAGLIDLPTVSGSPGPRSLSAGSGEKEEPDLAVGHLLRDGQRLSGPARRAWPPQGVHRHVRRRVGKICRQKRRRKSASCVVSVDARSLIVASSATPSMVASARTSFSIASAGAGDLSFSRSFEPVKCMSLEFLGLSCDCYASVCRRPTSFLELVQRNRQRPGAVRQPLSEFGRRTPPRQ
jgi:hypothetical protein